MPFQKNLWCKIPLLGFAAVLNLFLFFVVLRVNFQWELAREHVRFRSGFPSQSNWIPSPFGRLKSYLFNVTNAEDFLNGIDTKMKLQEIGPIVYRIKGRNLIQFQNDDSLIYEKIRYHETTFEPNESCSPDILNQTVILPNLVLLGAAAKLHDWVFPVRHVFNVITINEKVFLKRTVHYFLWDFTTPTLNLLSNYIPNMVSNCGMLYNALRQKKEIYNIKIGLNHGLQNFFRVNTLNNRTIFPEHFDKLKVLKNINDDFKCPVEYSNTFDNSLFPPFLKPNDKLKILASESCRVLDLKFNGTDKHLGFSGYRYNIGESSLKPSCLDKAMGIPLYKGMFDVSKCLFNDVPSAFSNPHFYDSSYEWNKHYEGLSPNAIEHEPHIIIEPVTGIPIEEKYRFQSNLPMPDMKGYSKELERFSNIVVPSFWYEFDMDELPLFIQIMMGLNVYIMPILQPILACISMSLTLYCCLRIYLLWKGYRLKDLITKIKNSSGKALETTFENDVCQEELQLQSVLK